MMVRSIPRLFEFIWSENCVALMQMFEGDEESRRMDWLSIEDAEVLLENLKASIKAAKK